MNKTEYEEELRRLVVPAIRAVLHSAGQKRIELHTRDVAIVWYEDVGGGRALARERRIQEPDWLSLFLLLERELSVETSLAAFRSAAAELFRAHGRPLSAFSGDPNRAWLLPMYEYFRRLGGLDIDEKLPRQVCDDFAADVTSHDAVLVSVFQVAGFSAEDRFDLDEHFVSGGAAWASRPT